MRTSSCLLPAFLRRLLGARVARGGADLSGAADQGVIPASAGGTQDVFMRALGEDLRKRIGQTLVIENRPGGNFNIGARACAESAAGRLHHLHASERGAGLQQAPVQEDPLRPGEGFRADHQSVLRDAGDRGECRSQGEEPRRARRAVAGEAQHHELHRARAAALGVHGEFQEAHRRRHGAGAVPRRRRDRQRRAFGHDAGGVLRAVELGVVSAGRDDRRAGGRRRQAAAADPRRADAGRARLQDRSHAGLFRHRRAGRHAEADPRAAAQRDGGGDQRSRLPREAPDLARPRAGRQYARRIRALPRARTARPPPASSRMPGSSRSRRPGGVCDSSAACGARHAR